MDTQVARGRTFATGIGRNPQMLDARVILAAARVRPDVQVQVLLDIRNVQPITP